MVNTLFTCVSQIAVADWSLDNNNSRLNFVTTKKGSVSEIQTFKSLSGNIDAKGHINFSIDLNSVDTAIPIRDERMQEHLFNTAKFPAMTLTATIASDTLSAMTSGTSKVIDIKADINLHGIKATMPASVLVSKLSKGTILVTSYKPVIIKADTFKLTAGIDKLKALAKLPSIDYTVPVSFSLTFNQ